MGAKHVTTVEYGVIESKHPKVTTLKPSDLRDIVLNGKLEPFDGVATFSSIEHSGLGRYGDTLNPWGDIQAVAKAWCVTKEGGPMYIGVPGGAEMIQWNAHRQYGPLRLPHLLANWEQVTKGPSSQPLYVVRRMAATFRRDMLKGQEGERALASYAPKQWMSGVSDWELHLPRENTAHDWCPQNSRAWIHNRYHEAAKAHATKCSSIVRVGGSGDGGKLICADKLQRDHCVVYSLGSRLEFSFETAIVRQFGCKVHTFDCTVGVPASGVVPRGVSFHPWCVGGRDESRPISSDLGHQGEIGQYYTLETIQGKLGHPRIDLLKMDIERHEFEVIQGLSRRALPAQIAFETHLHNAYGMWKRPVARSEWEMLWSKLRGFRYGVFSHEPNPLCLCCCEWSLLVET